MSNFRVKSLVVGMVETNCYVIYNEGTKEAVIVDPGDGPKQISAKCREYGVKPVAILLTHGHFDHTEDLFFEKRSGSPDRRK